MMKDYYRILEVHPEASQEVMNKAYRTLVQKYHPDGFHTSRKQYATARMQEINEAYEVLSNPAARRTYDAQYVPSFNTEPSLETAPVDWSRRLLRGLLWFAGTAAALLLLRGAGRFLLVTPLGKLLLLGFVAYLIFRFRVRPQPDKRSGDQHDG